MSLLRRLADRHLEVPVLALAALTFLVVGLSRPLLYVEKALFWDNEYSILTGTLAMLREGRTVPALLVALFVILLPLLRLAALLALWLLRLRAPARRRTLRLLDVLDMWSMVDVFALAAFVVGIQISDQMSTEVRSGAWLFGAGVLLSSLVTWRVHKLAGRPARN